MWVSLFTLLSIIHKPGFSKMERAPIEDSDQAPGGGGGGVLSFFFIRSLGPVIYRSPQNHIRNFKHLQKIFEIFSTENQKKYPPFYTLTLRKAHKMHRNDP